MRSAARQKSQNMPVNWPQSTQGRQSVWESPHAVTSKGPIALADMALQASEIGKLEGRLTK